MNVSQVALKCQEKDSGGFVGLYFSVSSTLQIYQVSFSVIEVHAHSYAHLYFHCSHTILDAPFRN